MSHALAASKRLRVTTLILVTVLVIPAKSFACACGCGVFDVSTSGMLPTQEGGVAWLEYDFMNQDRNWSHSSSSASANNDDKDIKTSFFTAGAQYMFSRSWGSEVEVPYWDRHFTTTDDSGNVGSFNHDAFGDVRIKGIYSGFSPDMSSGVTFGLKLPTGDWHYVNFDRDTSIGTGSTDILLGAYHQGNFAGSWNWFANGELDQPFLIRADYRPGAEVDAVSGVYYNGWSIGNVKIAPVAQVIGSYRLHDNGLAANPQNSGYERILLSPGIEADMAGMRVYGDVEVPLYQYVRGNQLTANVLFKVNVSRSF